jgi:hypothetical protein
MHLQHARINDALFAHVHICTHTYIYTYTHTYTGPLRCHSAPRTQAKRRIQNSRENTAQEERNRGSFTREFQERPLRGAAETDVQGRAKGHGGSGQPRPDTQARRLDACICQDACPGAVWSVARPLVLSAVCLSVYDCLLVCGCESMQLSVPVCARVLCICTNVHQSPCSAGSSLSNRVCFNGMHLLCVCFMHSYITRHGNICASAGFRQEITAAAHAHSRVAHTIMHAHMATQSCIHTHGHTIMHTHTWPHNHAYTHMAQTFTHSH